MNENRIYHDFGVELPEPLLDMIRQLDEAIQKKDLIIDCIQEEIRSLAHCYFNEPIAGEIIHYYCYRKWF